MRSGTGSNAERSRNGVLVASSHRVSCAGLIWRLLAARTPSDLTCILFKYSTCIPTRLLYGYVRAQETELVV